MKSVDFMKPSKIFAMKYCLSDAKPKVLNAVLEITVILHGVDPRNVMFYFHKMYLEYLTLLLRKILAYLITTNFYCYK